MKQTVTSTLLSNRNEHKRWIGTTSNEDQGVLVAEKFELIFRNFFPRRRLNSVVPSPGSIRGRKSGRSRDAALFTTKKGEIAAMVANNRNCSVRSQTEAKAISLARKRFLKSSSSGDVIAASIFVMVGATVGSTISSPAASWVENMSVTTSPSTSTRGELDATIARVRVLNWGDLGVNRKGRAVRHSLVGLYCPRQHCTDHRGICWDQV
ncbi:hypothetical protein BJ742DRAFT_813797 [Cladochytrium replicatum]|nr:hypothetical protein BJ742DRAFT_813797 [Cladochytrium replicatum]